MQMIKRFVLILGLMLILGPSLTSACEFWYEESPAYEGYRSNCKISDFFKESIKGLTFIQREIPPTPIDEYFVCDLFYLQSNSFSRLTYFFDFHGNGTLSGQFETDSYDTINLNGSYTYSYLLRDLQFTASGIYSLTGQARELTFSLKSEDIVQRLRMLGYVRASGELTDGPTTQPITNRPTQPIQMRCLAFGHRYNAVTGYMRFQCPDQVTAAGTYTNVFEFDSFVEGRVFRQRDFYASSNTGGNPNLIERGEFGIYRRVGDELSIDFDYGPDIPSPFSDFNALHGRLINNANQLVIDEFPQGNNICNRVP